MENQTLPDTVKSIQLDEYAKQTVRATAGIAGIAAILIIVRAVVTLTGFFVERSRTAVVVGDEYFDNAPKPESNGILSVIFAILVFVITALLSYFLYRFSTNAKSGVDNSEVAGVNTGLGALTYYFKLVGILLIIMMAIVIPVLMILMFFKKTLLFQTPLFG